MAKMNFKEVLNKSLQATKKYVDDQIVENKFSGDYNDLDNRPCYEDEGDIPEYLNIEIYSDTDFSDKENVEVINGTTSNGNYIYRKYVKLFSDITIDMINTMKEYGVFKSEYEGQPIEVPLIDMLDESQAEQGMYFIGREFEFILQAPEGYYLQENGLWYEESYIERDLNGNFITEYKTVNDFNGILLIKDNGELNAGTIKQLDEKFIPDSIARVEYVDNNKFSGDYNDLENRPCYDDRILITSFTSEEADNTILSGGDTAETFMVVDKVFPKIDPEKEYIVKLNGKEFTSYAMYVDNVNTFEDMPGYRNFPEGHYGIFLTTNRESLVFVYIVPNAEIGEDNRATPSETKSLIGFWDGMGSRSLKVEGLIEIYEAGGELKQLDEKFIPFETEEETLNRLLEAEFVLGTMQLEDGTYLTDNDGNIIIF